MFDMVWYQCRHCNETIDNWDPIDHMIAHCSAVGLTRWVPSADRWAIASLDEDHWVGFDPYPSTNKIWVYLFFRKRTRMGFGFVGEHHDTFSYVPTGVLYTLMKDNAPGVRR